MKKGLDEDTLLIAENLRMVTAKTRLTQKEVAAEAEISVSRMSEIYRGGASMSAPEFARVARVFGLRADWFLEVHLPEVKTSN